MSSPDPQKDNTTTLDSLIQEVTDGIRRSSSKPGYHIYKTILFTGQDPEDDVTATQDLEDVAKLRSEIFDIRNKVMRISQEHNIPFKEILAKAVDRHKEDSRQQQEVPQPAAKMAAEQQPTRKKEVRKRPRKGSPGQGPTRPSKQRQGQNAATTQPQLQLPPPPAPPPPSIPTQPTELQRLLLQQKPIAQDQIASQRIRLDQVMPFKVITSAAKPSLVNVQPVTIPQRDPPPQYRPADQNLAASDSSVVISSPPVQQNSPSVDGSSPVLNVVPQLQQPVVLQPQQPNPPAQVVRTVIVSQGSQASPIQPVVVPGPSREEERMLRYGKAILKLKQYRRNLKYAIWDYQDGKTLAEASQMHKIPEDGLRFSIDLIVKKTGFDNLESFRANKSLLCDDGNFGPAKTAEYISRLREAVVAFKQKKCGSLFVYANQYQVSLFDLVDELVKELEIESKLYRLTPVEPSQLQMHFRSQAKQSGTAADNSLVSNANNNNNNNNNGFSQVISTNNIFSDDPETASVLSDIDEVIRDDTNSSSRTLSMSSHDDSMPVQTMTLAEAEEAEGNVIMLNICGVCNRIFTDEKLFKEHESQGCIDYEA